MRSGRAEARLAQRAAIRAGRSGLPAIVEASPRLSQRVEAYPPPGTAGRFTVMSGYEGASQSRRMSPFVPNRQHTNSILAAEAPMLRARVRQLVANTAYGANASETFVSYAVGAGINPSPQITNSVQKKAIKQAWLDWTDEADADDGTDLYGLQAQAARALFDAGEVFIRFRDRFASDGLSVPLQLQLLEAEQLDISYITTAPNGNRIRCGIEFNSIGKRVAYHFWKEHPGDFTILNGGMGQRTRVPAEQVLHIFKKLRPGQIRGRPWLTPGLIKLYDLDRYSDAELTRKLGAALHMAFILQELGEDIGTTGLVDEDTEADELGTADVALEPGLAHVLPKGFDVKFNEPADVGPNYETFYYRNVLELCASMGLPYFAVSGDTSKANYSSLRAALVECRRRIEQFQWEVLIFQMCRPIYRRWLPTAVIAGAVRIPGFSINPRVLLRVKWITPRWDWVDPLKDAQAEKLMVDSGFKSRSRVIEERGDEPEEVDEEIAAEQDREELLGISFVKGGTAPTAPKSDDGEEDETAPGQNEPANDSEPARAAARNQRIDRERTVVTKRDAQGRIIEFERYAIGDDE